MGYVKKEKMKVDEKGRPFTVIGTYHVVKESEHMTGIYLYDCGLKTLVTSKPKWSQAIKLANLLNQAYKAGVESEREDNPYSF